MGIDRKQFVAKCKFLIQEYEDVFLSIIEEEEHSMGKDTSIGKSQFEVARDSIRNKSIIDGMRRMVALIHRHAKEE